jgi:hypothetical protein
LNQTDQPRLDLDQVAGELTSRQAIWSSKGITAAPLTWRDSQAAWPQPILTNRHQITEPESLGVRLSAGNGNEALVVIWRGGWATSTYWPSAT